MSYNRTLIKLLWGICCMSCHSYGMYKPVRIAFDIGSLITKMTVAKFNPHHNTYKILFKGTRAVEYKKDIERNNNQASQNIITLGIKAIKELKDEVKLEEKMACIACATASLRDVANWEVVKKNMQHNLNMPVRVISQEKEAELGFVGAINTVKIDNPESAVVWDAGGGSMQITAYDQNKKLRFYGNQCGLTSFTNDFMKFVQGKKALLSHSPNPLTAADLRSVARFFKIYYGSSLIPDWLKAKINAPETLLIGIGAMYYSICGAENQKIFRLFLNDFEKMLNERCGKKDEDLRTMIHESLSPSVAATSIALFIHFIKTNGLNLEKKPITVANVDISNGMIFDEALWSHLQ